MSGLDKELNLDEDNGAKETDAPQNQYVSNEITKRSFELLKQIVDKKQEQTKLQGPNIPYLAAQILSKLSNGSASV